MSEVNVTKEEKDEARQLRQTTTILLILCSLILLAWDVKVATNEVKDDTISELLRDVSWDVWLLPFMLMGVMGHLFWNRPGVHKETKHALLIGSCLVIGLRDIVWHVASLPPLPYANLACGAVGFVLGARWWPQLRPPGQRKDPV